MRKLEDNVTSRHSLALENLIKNNVDAKYQYIRKNPNTFLLREKIFI